MGYRTEVTLHNDVTTALPTAVSVVSETTAWYRKASVDYGSKGGVDYGSKDGVDYGNKGGAMMSEAVCGPFRPALSCPILSEN